MKAVKAFVVVALLTAVAGCGKSASEVSGPTGSASSSAAATEQLKIDTPPAVGDVTTPLVWGVYRETNSLDPAKAFDYPENTVVFTLCDALQRQQPDGSIAPGLSTITNPDPKTFVITLKEGVKFWDGTPLTSADVAYSLNRNRDPEVGGFYAEVFSRVKQIEATGPLVVTITLNQPDYWLLGELSGPAGVVVQKAFTESKGDKFGTVDGGVMCTGPYKLDSWRTGVGVTVVRNEAYWDTTLKPKAAKVTFKGYPDNAAATSALQTGELSGIYPLQSPTLDQLKASQEVNVYRGPAANQDLMIVSSLTGALGDVRVRQALSKALDREGLIATLYKGAGRLPRTLNNPGTWGYGKDVFQQMWDSLPDPTLDLEGAKTLVKQAGAEGKTITLGTSAELPLNTTAQAMQSAAEAIGLKVVLKSVSAANYINFFIDPAARQGIDGFFTSNYGDYADPAALLSTIVIPKGSQNYDGYSNPQITAAMEAGRSEPDPAKRAAHIAAAEKLAMADLPWIPIVAPDTVLVMNKKITGAPASFQYMFGPWLASLGAAG